MRIGEIIQQLQGPAADGQGQTADGLQAGHPDTEVTGIAVAFMATQGVIMQAIAQGANLLITHEGIFYSHHTPSKHTSDPIYRRKKDLIDTSGLAIFRFHDGPHRTQPDEITAGLIAELGWEAYVEEQQPEATIVELPARSLAEMGEYVKRQLGIPYVRAVGDLSQPCSRVGVLVGFRGSGELCIPLYEHKRLDLIIGGEMFEWETPEYVRDAVLQGVGKSLLLLGHAHSEVPGMKRLAVRLQDRNPSVPVFFLAGEHDFQLI